jgi:hypothetical protein
MDRVFFESLKGGEDGAWSLCGYPVDEGDLFETFFAERCSSFLSDHQGDGWLYVELLGPTGQKGHVIYVPENTRIAPPTVALQPLAKALSVNQDFWLIDEQSPKSTTVHVLLEGASWSDIPNIDALPELFSGQWLETANDLKSDRVRIEKEFGADDTRKLSFGLACKAPVIAYPKYRFLEYYRSVERLYMKMVFDRLATDFYVSPRKAIDEASSAISREAEALFVTVEKVGALDEAEAVYDIITSLPSNRFALALVRKLKAKSEEVAAAGAITKADFANKKRMGSELLYGIRCAIVHAGARDIMIESFPDADEVLDAVEAYLSRIALACSGIRF